jgi:hypothetical protein
MRPQWTLGFHERKRADEIKVRLEVESEHGAHICLEDLQYALLKDAPAGSLWLLGEGRLLKANEARNRTPNFNTDLNTWF